MPQNNDNSPAGPGAIEDAQIAPNPLLQGASVYEYITLRNPLPVEFVGKVAITMPVNAPVRIGQDNSGGQVTLSESDVLRNYGLTLKNKDHTGRVNIVNRVHIPAGKTINLLGNEAQVVCFQLVSEIMQRAGQRLMLADPHARNVVEQQVIVGRSSVNDILDGKGPIAVQEQLRGAVDDLNNKQVVTDESEFPDLNIKPTRQLRKTVGK